MSELKFEDLEQMISEEDKEKVRKLAKERKQKYLDKGIVVV